MIVNEQTDTSKLPFDVEKTYYVGTDAWYKDYDLIQKIQMDIGEFNTTDRIYLIVAEPACKYHDLRVMEYRQK